MFNDFHDCFTRSYSPSWKVLTISVRRVQNGVVDGEWEKKPERREWHSGLSPPPLPVERFLEEGSFLNDVIVQVIFIYHQH